MGAENVNASAAFYMKDDNLYLPEAGRSMVLYIPQNTI